MNPLMQYTTKQLVEELSRREGVTEYAFELGDEFEIGNENGTLTSEFGPARILVVID